MFFSSLERKYIFISILVFILVSILVFFLQFRSIGTFLFNPLIVILIVSSFISCFIFFAGYIPGKIRQSNQLAEKLEGERHQKVGDELTEKAAFNQKPELSLKNVVRSIYTTEKPSGIRYLFDRIGYLEYSSTAVRYDIEDASGNVIGRFHRQILCAECGGELKRGLQINGVRSCPSCGAHTRLFLRTLEGYVFEGLDGTRKGGIRQNRHQWIEYSIFDAQNQLKAIVKEESARKMGSMDLIGHRIGLFDSNYRIMAEYYGDSSGCDYMIITPDRRIIAEVHRKEDQPEYDAHASSDSSDSLLVLSYVVLIDIISHKLEIARIRREYSNDGDD